MTASKTFLAKYYVSQLRSTKSRPALDVVVPDAAAPLADVVEAIADDFHPFAVEAISHQGPRGANRSDLVRIHFLRDSDRNSAARAITDRLGHAGVVVDPVDVPDDGARWAERSQRELRAVRVGDIVVAPPWDTSSSPADTSTIVIQPSMGFGTGHHASTRLCLRALQTQPVRGDTVTDLGTGSGVLAIAAATLGARLVVALEQDADAIASARENLKANAVFDTVKLLHADLSTATLPLPAGIVVANLTGAVLRQCAGRVAACAVSGGALILGGLSNDEEAGVIDAFASLAQPVKSLREEEWSCLMLRTHRRGSAAPGVGSLAHR